MHGGYDLANAINPQPAYTQLASLPSAVDPRGLLTFGLTGLSLLVIARLMGLSRAFPRALSYLGYLLAILLIALYLGRLILLNPANPLLLGTALLSGFLVGPLWYIWLGMQLLHK
jgi:FtsH-binding integral membrane protein